MAINGRQMLSFLFWFLTTISGLLCIPVLLLLVEVIAALPSPKEKPFEATTRATTKKTAAVIVPAHNEGEGILPTLQDIKPQLDESDRLIVVADNCSDDTATVAKAAGAEVVERKDTQRIGKGYALDYGLNYLSKAPPEFVVFIDADCRIQSDMIGRLKAVCNNLQCPVQATFLMSTPPNSPINYRVAEFAWTVKNWVRPLGLRYLNCPIQLMGTGMIFPWDVVRSVSIASGNLVEDMKLGLDLAAARKAPRFYPFVIGTSYFPTTKKAAFGQRQRWEHGHIRMILRAAPQLVKAVKELKFELLVLTLDLLVPPLSLLAMLIFALFGVSLAGVFVGLGSAPALVGLGNLLAFVVAVFLAWLKFGRRILPLRSVLSIGPYLFSKFFLYGLIFSGQSVTKWIRTDRDARN